MGTIHCLKGRSLLFLLLVSLVWLGLGWLGVLAVVEVLC